MRKIFCLLSLIGAVTSARGQIISEDAKGESSILFKNSQLGLNVKEAALSASINNFRKIDGAPPKLFLWQLSATGKNESGLASLWNEGNLQVGSKIEGFIGYRVRGRRYENILSDSVQRLKATLALVNIKRSSFSQEIDSLIKSSSDFDAATKAALQEGIADLFKTLRSSGKVFDTLKEIEADSATSPNIKSALSTRIIPYMKSRFDQVEALTDQIDVANAALTTYKQSNTRRVITGYLNFGMASSEYHLHARPTALPFANRFDTSKFRGGFIHVGLNYDVGPYWVLGVAVGYERANTFDSLKKKEYTERTSETSGQQTFLSEKKYSAYNGFYHGYDRANIKVDIQFFGVIDDKDLSYVWNVLYARLHLPIDEEKVKGVVNLGTSINFFKADGKFAGGIYLEQNDVTGNLDTDLNFWKRLNFGVTTKFSFLGFFSRK